MSAERKRARRITVISGKGGVGKTVIAANMAAELSSMGHRVLVVDGDLGLASLDILLGISPRLTIHEALRKSSPLDQALVPTRKGFDLLPAGSGLPENTVFTAALAKELQSVLKDAEYRYDAIIIDASAGIGDFVMFFAGLSDEILLVATPEPTSVVDCYATIKILKQLQGRNEFLLVINQADPECPNRVGFYIASHLQNVISRFIGSAENSRVCIRLIGSIPMDPAIPRAIRNRQLLAEANPQAPAAALMRDLAGYLHTRI
jgi:flagellar biosynthesis protein FlhG